MRKRIELLDRQIFRAEGVGYRGPRKSRGVHRRKHQSRKTRANDWSRVVRWDGRHWFEKRM